VLAEDMPIFAVEAFKLFIGETAPNPSSAGVLGVLLILTTSAVLLVQRRFLSRRRFATHTRQAPPLLKVGGGVQMAATAYCWAIVILALVPFFSIVVLSFLEFRGPVLHGNFSLDNFGFLFSRALQPLFNTLIFATVASLLVTVIGVPIGYVVTRNRGGIASLLDVLATLPFAVAGTVLAIGFIVSFNAGILVLTGGPLILVLAYTVRKVPFAVRSSSAIVHQIDGSLEEASISLGRSPLQTFLRIVVPLMLGGILSGLVLSWVTVASELSATVVLYSGPWSTLTVVMFQALESGGAGIATAAASFLIVVSLLPIAFLYRLVRRYELS
jgi:iron(III) transport system permease protein